MAGSRWQDLLQSGQKAAAELQLLTSLATCCDLLRPGDIRRRQDLIESERGTTVPELGLDEADAAMIRLELDEEAFANLRRNGDDRAMHEIVEDVALTIPRYFAVDHPEESALQGHNLVLSRDNKPVLYLDFKGDHAAADALQLFTAIQSAIEQRGAAR